ncbi:MAG: hypothetical protein KBE86_12560, partial [Chitinophagales bacterium]|nr:hypothetical protein [Chitinophagales bacterium]
YNFLNKLDISYLHVFTYSERPNTAAITMDGIVPKKIRDERTQQLINLSIKKRRYFYEQFVGTTRSVLFEAETNGDIMFGFTDNYIRVKTQFDPMLVNEVCHAELLQIDSDGDMWCNPLPENLNHSTTIQKNKLYTA